MPKPRPKVATREIVNGRIHACDANGRPCFDLDNPERVVLTRDFREYAPELHRGALGWTVPTDSDGYTFARIAFDAGPRLRLRNFTVDRVPAETAEVIAAEIIAENRNTRFDADRVIAARHYQEFLASYANTLSLASTKLRRDGRPRGLRVHIPVPGRDRDPQRRSRLPSQNRLYEIGVWRRGRADSIAHHRESGLPRKARRIARLQDLGRPQDRDPTASQVTGDGPQGRIARPRVVPHVDSSSCATSSPAANTRPCPTTESSSGATKPSPRGLTRSCGTARSSKWGWFQDRPPQ